MDIEWTPIEEAMPSLDGRYLVTDAWGEVDCVYFEKEEGFYKDDVIAWMSLPKAYV